jgi:conjugative relaxase-like TrwC/TraI family protein
MLTTRKIRGGAEYAENHLSSNDYYSEKERIVGHWQGRGAELLALSGEVRMDQLEAVRTGCDPRTGEFLRQRRSVDRYHVDGKKHADGVNLYDFVISAPKAVSVQSVFDQRLVEAHRIAAIETMVEMEKTAATRVRIGGANEDRITGNLVIARYEHDTSRELDPDLHTHFLTANLTYHGIERRWKALAARLDTTISNTLSHTTAICWQRKARSADTKSRTSSKTGKTSGFPFRASRNRRSKNSASAVFNVTKR